MTIRKVQGEGKAVPSESREVIPNLAGWIGDKASIINTPFIFIYHYEQIGGPAKLKNRLIVT